MNIRVMKTTLVFFILALTTNTAVLASAARCSPLRHNLPAISLKSHILSIIIPHLMRNPVLPSIQFIPLNKLYDNAIKYSSPLTGEVRWGCNLFLFKNFITLPLSLPSREGKKTGIVKQPLKIRGTERSYDYSVVPVQTRIQKIKFVHYTRKLLNPDEVIIIASLTSKIFNSIRAVSIPISKISSNNLLDIFIPPK